MSRSALSSLFFDHDRRQREVLDYEGVCIGSRCVVVVILAHGSEFLSGGDIAWHGEHGYALMSDRVPAQHRGRLVRYLLALADHGRHGSDQNTRHVTVIVESANCDCVVIRADGSDFLPGHDIAWHGEHGYALMSDRVPAEHRGRMAEFLLRTDALRRHHPDPCLRAVMEMVESMNGTADLPFMRYWCEQLRLYSQWAWRTKHERMAPVDEVYGIVYAYTYLHAWLQHH